MTKFVKKLKMMATDEMLLITQFQELPATVQKEVLDFVGYLSTKYKKKRSSKKRKAGSMKGLISYMADDFNAPLEDFKGHI